MAEHHSSMSPSERDAFGNWISGFSDGEGCFYLGVTTKRKGGHVCAMTRFDLHIRADDRPILEDIKAYWGVGFIGEHAQRGPSKQKSCYTACRLVDLVNVLIPHFEAYPLRAKKRRDFTIWRRGVELHYRVQSRPNVPKPKWRNGQVRGMKAKWSLPEMEEFKSLVTELRAVRQFHYDGPEPVFSKPIVKESVRLLFQ